MYILLNKRYVLFCSVKQQGAKSLYCRLSSDTRFGAILYWSSTGSEVYLLSQFNVSKSWNKKTAGSEEYSPNGYCL